MNELCPKASDYLYIYDICDICARESINKPLFAHDCILDPQEGGSSKVCHPKKSCHLKTVETLCKAEFRGTFAVILWMAILCEVPVRCTSSHDVPGDQRIIGKTPQDAPSLMTTPETPEPEEDDAMAIHINWGLIHDSLCFRVASIHLASCPINGKLGFKKREFSTTQRWLTDALRFIHPNPSNQKKNIYIYI